jgi:uncharacterized membrane protein (GlpM family)
MQEDENQPEEEQQPLSEKEAEEKQPEQEQQPISGDAAGASQSHASGSQPPPGAPTPLPLTQQEKRRQYFLSLGFGLIPVIVLLVTFGIGTQQGQNGLGTLILGGLAALLLYIIELITTIVLLVNKQRRFAGYGLLTAFLVTPIIAAIGCTVIPQVIHP